MAKRLMQMFAIACFMLVCCGLLKPASAQVPRSSYLEYVKRAAAEGWEAYPRVVAEWRANVKPSVLWGYDAPAQPIYLADILSFLYQETSDPLYARRAAQILADYGDLRNAYPKDYYKTRAEYAEGVPSMANFFFVPPYSRSYMRIRDSGVLDPAAKAKIEAELAQSLDFIFHFPEWGSHNRAMLRAEGLYYGSLAIPGHAHAPRWRQMAEILASDNVDDWEAEDATIYHPVWLEALLSYADASGDDARIYRLPFLAYYAQYFKQLFTPAGTIADLGDADWNPSWFRYVAAFEKLAGEYRDPELKWIAWQLFENNTGTGQPTDVVAAASLAHAYLWANDTVGAQKPVALSQEALDDIVGKKVVFRNGWDSTSTYLLLNYRDEGEGAFATREFLRNTLSVEEEKTHHGHSDENDISILMSGGSVLLHDGGYRSGLPSGPYGAYRADYFHNRMVVRKNKRDRYQTLPEFIRNAGAHRPVRTQKIDFFSFHDVDMSRTRVYDDKIGYVWDRIITYVKPQDFFIVIDAVKAQEPDYYTFSNIWHTQHIHEQGPHYYATSIDSIRSAHLPQDKRLLIQFLANEAKSDSFYTEDRHYQQEQAIYQTEASNYKDGDYEIFITVLYPFNSGDPVAPYLNRVKLLSTADYPRSVALQIDGSNGSRSYLGLKIDLQSELARENIRPRYTWENGRYAFGDFETDAHFIYATVTDDSVRYAASNVLKVIYDGRPLMQALPNTHGLQLDGAPDRVGFVKWRAWEGASGR